MQEKNYLKTIQKLLDTYIPDPQVPLVHKNAFELLVATVLSAQCTDEIVNRVTKELFAIYPTPEKLALAEPSDIQKCIAPCGLSRKKAFFLQDLSKDLVQKFYGNVPDSLQELTSLSGVGHKTASCVLSHIFHIPAFPVDTHVFRLAHRWKLSEGKTVERVEEDLKKFFPKKLWGRIHLQMVLYGRKYCTAKRHDVRSCPICSFVHEERP